MFLYLIRLSEFSPIVLLTVSSATYFDIILSIPILWGIYRGFCKGFIIELASLAALVLGIWGSVKFSDYISIFLKETFMWDYQYLPLISFAVTFILIVIAVHLLAKLIETFVNIASLKLINKIAGALFGMVKTAVIILIFLFIVKSVDNRLSWIPADIKGGSFFFRMSARIPLNKFRLEKFRSEDFLTELYYSSPSLRGK